MQGSKTYAGVTDSNVYHHFAGKECLDVHLLKPARVDALPGQPSVLCNDDDVHQPAWQPWLEYPFRRVHPILRWLPSKLATWIGKKLWAGAVYTPKQGLEWTVGELKAILENNLVPSHNGRGQLKTFCWSSAGPKARCYPFNLRGHRFRGKNSQVCHII